VTAAAAILAADVVGSRRVGEEGEDRSTSLSQPQQRRARVL
jgi:hypothetical protein